MKRTHAAIACVLSLALVIWTPVLSFAESDAETPDSDGAPASLEAPAAEQINVTTAFDPALDKFADFSGFSDISNISDFSGVPETYEKTYEAPAPEELRLLTTYPVISLSDEFKYFAKYESGQNYDQGISAGDGYHALGYYQLDNRYELQPFITYCYDYNSEKYVMFAPYIEGGLDIKDNDVWLTVRDQVSNAWHMAYAADAAEFSALQDSYLYYMSYVNTERDLAKMGIDISGRADCVKGLCFGASNLFGLMGYHRFVGGPVLLIVNGTQVSKNFPGCGLDNEMSDVEFAVSLTTYIADHVAEFYPSQTIYHEGWRNRYLSERRDCLSFLPDLLGGAWYGPYIEYVKAKGFMTGYSDGLLAGRFGPEDRLTRAQVVTTLYRAFGSYGVPSSAADLPYDDLESGVYYLDALAWATANGIARGWQSGATLVFAPNDFITREDVATMLGRVAELLGVDVAQAPSSTLNGFIDGGAVSPYAADYVEWCAQQGILTGSQVGNTVTLMPQGICKRAQMAKIITIARRDVLAQ